MRHGTGSGVRRTAKNIAASALAFALGVAALHAWIRYDPPLWWIFNTRGHWKITIYNMGQLALVLDSYAKDNAGRFPVAEGEVEQLTQLRGQLEPTYSKRVMPDGWGRSLLYRSDGTSYELRSRGRDGREDSAGEVVRRVDQDLVLRNGAWVENDIFALMMSKEMRL